MVDFKQNEHVASLKQTLKLIDQSNESTRTLVNKALKLIELLDEVLQKSEFKRITNERLLQTCDEEVEQLKQFTELVVKEACAGKMVMKPDVVEHETEEMYSSSDMRYNLRNRERVNYKN